MSDSLEERRRLVEQARKEFIEAKRLERERGTAFAGDAANESRQAAQERAKRQAQQTYQGVGFDERDYEDDRYMPTDNNIEYVPPPIRTGLGFDLTIPTLDISGTRGIDEAKLRESLVKAWRYSKQREFQEAADRGDETAKEGYAAWLYGKAHDEIKAWQMDDRNAAAIWYDTDDQKATRDILKDWGLDDSEDRDISVPSLEEWRREPLQSVGATARELVRATGITPAQMVGAGVEAWLNPITAQTFALDEKGEPVTGRASVKEGVLGWLNWALQGPDLFFSTAIAAGTEPQEPDADAPSLAFGDDSVRARFMRGVGTEEQLHRIRNLEDSLQHSEQFAGALPITWAIDELGLADEGSFADRALESIAGRKVETKELAHQLAGGVPALAVMLLEPDATWLTFGLGKIAKGVSKVGRVASGLQKGMTKAEALATPINAQRHLQAAGRIDNIADEFDANIADGMDPDKAVDAAMEKLSNEAGFRPTAVVRHAYTARMALRFKPGAEASAKTKKTMKMAQRAQDRLLKTMQDASDAARKAGDVPVKKGKSTAGVEAASPGRTKFAYKRFRNANTKEAVAAAELQQAQLVNMADARLHADLERARDVINLTHGGAAPRKPKLSVEDFAKRLQDAQTTLESARRQVISAFGTPQYDKALEALNVAQRAFVRQQIEAADALGYSARKVLDAQIKTAKESLQASAENLKALQESMRKDGLLRVDPKHHNTLVRRAVAQIRGGGKADVDDAARAELVFSKTLKDAAESYRGLAKVSKDPSILHSAINPARIAKEAPEAMSAEDALTHLHTHGITEDMLASAARTDQHAAAFQEALKRGLKVNVDRAAVRRLAESAKQADVRAKELAERLPLAQAEELRREWLEGLRSDTLNDISDFLAGALKKIPGRAAPGADPTVVDRALATAGRAVKGADVLAQRAKREVATRLEPARATLGPGKKEVMQIGKGMLDGQRIAEKEVIEILDGAKNPQEQIENLHRWLNGEAVEAKGIMNRLGGGTIMNRMGDGMSLWDEAVVFARSLAVDPNPKKFAKQLRVANSKSLKALALMWLPRGKRAAEVEAKLQAYVYKLLADPKGITFSDFSEKMRLKTIDEMQVPIAAEGAAAARATAFAAMAISNLALLKRGGDSLAGVLAGLSPRTVKAAAKVQKNKPLGLGAQDYEGLMQAFANLGVPPNITNIMGDVGKEMEVGLRALGSKSDGYYTLMPRQWMNAMESRIDRVVKSVDEANAGAVEPLIAKALGAGHNVMNWFKTGITTGVMFPRPMYFINMMLGNFSQIWAEEGLGVATRNFAQWAPGTLGSFIPGLGSALDRIGRGMQKRLGTDKDILTFLPSALYNPHISAFFDSRLAPDAATINGKNGRVYTMGELRKLANENGVLSSFSSLELQQVLRRTALEDGGILGKHARGNRLWFNPDLYKQVADQMELRQRVGLFTDLVVNKGVDPVEAGERVRNALYDWGHASTSAEAKGILDMVMFYRFWRLSMGQGLRLITAPFSAAYKGPGAMGGGLELYNGMGRVKSIQRSIDYVQEATREAFQPTSFEPTPEQKEAGWTAEDVEYHWSLAARYPWWAGKSAKPWLGNVPLTRAQLDKQAAAMFGRKPDGSYWTYTELRPEWRAHVNSHKAITMPALTPLDTTSMLISTLGNLAAAATGRRQDKVDFATEVVGDMLNPVAEKMLEGGVASLTGKGSYGSRGSKIPEWQRVLISDEAGRPREWTLDEYGNMKGDGPIRSLLLWSFGSPSYDPKDPPGTLRANPIHVAIRRMLPVVGQEFDSWLNAPAVLATGAVGGANSPNEIMEGVRYILGQYSGLGREYFHAPELTTGPRGAPAEGYGTKALQYGKLRAEQAAAKKAPSAAEAMQRKALQGR